MMKSVELGIGFVRELPPLRGLVKEHRGTWDEPDGGCDRFSLAADPVVVENAFDYYSLLPPDEHARWTLGELDRDWHGFEAGSLVLYPREFLEWVSNRVWVFLR